MTEPVPVSAQQRYADNVFLIPDATGSNILYAPLAGLAARLNAQAAKQLASFLATGDEGEVAPSVSQALGGLQRLTEGTWPVPRDTSGPFRPQHLTIFPSNACNLNCAYCYASAGSRPREVIDLAFVEAALDLLKASVDAAQPVPVNFHGGGEPMLQLDIVARSMEAARSRFGSRARFGIATNGVLTATQREYLARNFHSVNVSLDGPADIQNAQRPLRSGEGSFDAVMATIECLRSQGVEHAIRATITSQTVSRLLEIAEFIIREVRCKVFAFEPVFACGRCETRPEMVPDPEVFSREFIRAYDYCCAHDVVLHYSGARVGSVVDCFCSVSRDSFNITPDGCVTPCFEVCSGGHKFASRFIYGRYDAEEQRILIDMERLRSLRTLGVENRRQCDSCFCRWHCGGDCAVKIAELEAAGCAYNLRCDITQALTRHMLAHLLDRNLEIRGSEMSKADPVLAEPLPT